MSAIKIYRAEGYGAHIRSVTALSSEVETVRLNALSNRVYVTEASHLAGTLSSTVEYFIDGVIDMGDQQITVPPGGLNLSGYNFDLSQLISSANNYTMFISAGCGNILGKDYGITTSGTGSQVYDLTALTGNEAFEFARINYNGCTSLGELTNFRQGLEVGTGRFGGSPSLTLSGTWLGGFVIDTSIVRGLSAGMTGSLFKEGTGFTMASRFKTNINADLPANASLFDFRSANFTNPSTLQLIGAIVTRDGVFDSSDPNITPNITSSDLACSWDSNVGVDSTFEGGLASISAEVTTVITSTGVFYPLLGTWSTSALQHFDSPSNGQLRHLGNTPREYRITASLTIEGPASDEVVVKVVKWDDSAGSFVDVISQIREINSFAGGRDIGFYTIISQINLDLNDYVTLEIKNDSSTGNLTVETDSFFLIEER